MGVKIKVHPMRWIMSVWDKESSKGCQMPNMMHELSLFLASGMLLAVLALIALVRWWRHRR
jgi:hypothetical protein